MTLVVREGMTLPVFGLAGGIASSLAVAQLLRSALYGVSATSVSVYAAVTLLLGVVATLACYVPARRTARVDPVVALRA